MLAAFENEAAIINLDQQKQGGVDPGGGIGMVVNSSESSTTSSTPGVAQACLICRPNSHPFNDRTLGKSKLPKKIYYKNFILAVESHQKF